MEIPTYFEMQTNSAGRDDKTDKVKNKDQKNDIIQMVNFLCYDDAYIGTNIELDYL